MSRSRTICTGVLTAMTVASVSACAGRAPAPVAVVQSADDALSCTALLAEVSSNNSNISELGREKGAKVAQNVAAGVVGLFVWPVWFLMDFQGAAGTEIKSLQDRNAYLATKINGDGCAGAPSYASRANARTGAAPAYTSPSARTYSNAASPAANGSRATVPGYVTVGDPYAIDPPTTADPRSIPVQPLAAEVHTWEGDAPRRTLAGQDVNAGPSSRTPNTTGQARTVIYTIAPVSPAVETALASDTQRGAYQQNLEACMDGRFSAFCDHSRLTSYDVSRVREAEHQANLATWAVN